METDLDRRLTDLEIRLTHHERLAEDLSEVVAAQDKRIERLTLQVRHLAKRLREVDPGPDRSPSDDRPPPHY
ncbi:MAG: SlyX family protein [Rhodospirillum sp.]|nr:SlyX family protein [Rhodospirillum sp.]MCF8491163.1 SlyX family protein [Rhodospirillum sp.]MCF8502668.1 SlyX family protein [Rhodospirillum sp.]